MVYRLSQLQNEDQDTILLYYCLKVILLVKITPRGSKLLKK